MDDTKRCKVQRQSKLTEVERSYIMTLLASGLSLREVSRKAAEKGIRISHQNVAKYRPKIAEKLPEIIADKDESALKRGIALKEVRVQKLADMESLMYDSIYQRVKSGCSVEALIREWRGLLDDVAKEMGDRRNVNNNTINVNNTINHYQTLNALLDKTYKQLDSGDVIDGETVDERD